MFAESPAEVIFSQWALADRPGTWRQERLNGFWTEPKYVLLKTELGRVPKTSPSVSVCRMAWGRRLAMGIKPLGPSPESRSTQRSRNQGFSSRRSSRPDCWSRKVWVKSRMSSRLWSPPERFQILSEGEIRSAPLRSSQSAGLSATRGLVHRRRQLAGQQRWRGREFARGQSEGCWLPEAMWTGQGSHQH